MADELKTSEEVLRIGDVAGLVTQMLADDKPKMELFTRIDAAVACVFEPDANIKALPWVQNRHYGMPDIADARNTGVRTFATLMPQIEIAPLNDEAQEYERTDMAEQAWMWEFERMNRVGKKSIHEQIMEDAMSYHAVALQTKYLPYALKRQEKSPKVKAMLRSRCFDWIRHHPATVHPRYSDYGLEAVAKVHPYSLQTLIDNFGVGNPGVAKLMEKHRNAKKDELLRTKYILVDYMDWKNRVQFALPSPTENIPSVLGESDIVFMNEAHGLPFIPWVIVDKGDPIWKTVIQSGMWDNMQYLNLIRFAKAIEQGTRSNIVVQTPDGTLKSVWIDPANPSNPIVTPLDGTVVRELSAAPIDPQLENIFNGMKTDAASSTVSHVLRDLSRFGDTPFSSVNQMVNLALGQLARAKNAAEDAESIAIYQGFEWISHSGIPFNAYRPKDKDSKVEGKTNGRGGQIYISPKEAPDEEEISRMSEKEIAMLERTVYYDLESLYIRVHLQSNNATDEQSRQNVVINAIDKMKMSVKEAWEKMGWGDKYEISQTQRREEMFEDIEMQNEAMRANMEVREQIRQELMQEIQQQQAEAQKQALEQQKSQQAQLNELGGGSQPTTQGLDMRAGGNPQALAAPQNTREQVSGFSRSGEQIQR